VTSFGHIEKQYKESCKTLPKRIVLMEIGYIWTFGFNALDIRAIIEKDWTFKTAG
jgi:hypothetical protein